MTITLKKENEATTMNTDKTIMTQAEKNALKKNLLDFVQRITKTEIQSNEQLIAQINILPDVLHAISYLF